MPAQTLIQRPDLYYHHSYDLDPDSGRLHCHSQHELYYFISGQGEYYIEGSRIRLVPRMLLLLRPTTFHYFNLTGDQPYERCALHFSGQGLVEEDWQLFLRTVSKPSDLAESLTVFPASGWPFWQDAYDRLDQAASLPEDEARLLSRSVLMDMIAQLIRYSRNLTRADAPQQWVTRTLTSEVTDYLSRHLTEDLSLDALAAHFYISKYHLCRTFKKATGTTVLEYLTQKRVILAQNLLKQNLLPKHVAIQCGFSDYSSFYRAFRRHVGLSPREYQQTGS